MSVAKEQAKRELAFKEFWKKSSHSHLKKCRNSAENR